MFIPSKALEKQERAFNGEWKNCRRCGCEVYLVPTSHPGFLKKLRELERMYRQKNGLVGRRADVELSDEVKEQHARQAIAETLVKDWRGIVDEKMEPIPFSPEMAAKFLADIVEFKYDVMDLVNSDEEIAAEIQETTSGN